MRQDNNGSILVLAELVDPDFCVGVHPVVPEAAAKNRLRCEKVDRSTLRVQKNRRFLWKHPLGCLATQPDRVRFHHWSLPNSHSEHHPRLRSHHPTRFQDPVDLGAVEHPRTQDNWSFSVRNPDCQLVNLHLHGTTAYLSSDLPNARSELRGPKAHASRSDQCQPGFSLQRMLHGSNETGPALSPLSAFTQLTCQCSLS